ncbi:MAG: 16S rRNA processing protein RimM [Spirochaetaceae bacterium]|nr:MAG: 16S rRNA processing protein RimM [Spirochaetaceae bacterium]
MGDEDHTQLLAVGRIQTSHGLKGYLKVRSLSGEIGHLLRLKAVQVGAAGKQTLFEVEDIRAAGKAVLVKLAGIDDREKGDKYRGQLIWVERRHASVLGEEEYYVADLQGCRLFQGQTLIGLVVAVPEGGGGDFLEVESSTGKRLIVPFSKHFVGKVDVAERRIELTEAYEMP